LFQESNANPEARTGLPNLSEVIARERLRLLSLLHGMVQAWVQSGMPAGHVGGLGGFEGWTESAGGVLEIRGFAGQLDANLSTWREETDAETGDMERFLVAWRWAGGETRVWMARELLDLAKRNGMFPEIFGRNEHGRLVAFSKSVIKPLMEVLHGISDDGGALQTFCVVRTGSSTSHRGFQYRLEVT
jgi:hypothetical protein